MKLSDQTRMEDDVNASASEETFCVPNETRKGKGMSVYPFRLAVCSDQAAFNECSV